MATLTVFMLFPVAAYTMSSVLKAYTVLDTYAPRPSLQQTGLNFEGFLQVSPGMCIMLLLHRWKHATSADLPTPSLWDLPAPLVICTWL